MDCRESSHHVCFNLLIGNVIYSNVANITKCQINPKWECHMEFIINEVEYMIEMKYAISTVDRRIAHLPPTGPSTVLVCYEPPGVTWSENFYQL